MASKSTTNAPDFILDKEANYRLLDNLNAFYAGTLRPPKFRLESEFVNYGGKPRLYYSIRSNIVMRVPT